MTHTYRYKRPFFVVSHFPFAPFSSRCLSSLSYFNYLNDCRVFFLNELTEPTRPFEWSQTLLSLSNLWRWTTRLIERHTRLFIATTRAAPPLPKCSWTSPLLYLLHSSIFLSFFVPRRLSSKLFRILLYSDLFFLLLAS